MSNSNLKDELMSLKLEDIANDEVSTKSTTPDSQYADFLNILKENRPRPRSRPYEIEDDILQVFKLIDIDRAYTVSMINAALRSWIKSNAEDLKKDMITFPIIT